MYRYQRPLTVFTRRFSRRSFPTQQNGEVRVQRVRLVRPSLRGRLLPKIVFWAVTFNLAWVALGRGWGADDEDEQDAVSVKEAVKQARVTAQTEHAGVGGEVGVGTQEKVVAVAESEGEEDEEEDEDELVPEDQPEDAWFIPLWFAQEREREYYSADDPEWQSFVEFSKDMKFRNAVKHSLIKYLFEKFTSDRKIRQQMGPPIKVGRVWLEFYYPHGPPPEWERFGIEITDEYVALMYRPVDAHNVRRAQNTLWPQRALLSFWASLQMLWRAEAARFEEMWESLKEERGDGDAQGTTDPKNGIAGAHGHSDTSDKSANSMQIAGQDRRDKRFRLPLMSLPKPSEELQDAMVVFRKFYNKQGKQKLQTNMIPTGSMLCAGLVELVGVKDILVLDVQAHFNPQERTISYINTSLQSVRPTKLRARGQPQRHDAVDVDRGTGGGKGGGGERGKADRGDAGTVDQGGGAKADEGKPQGRDVNKDKDKPKGRDAENGKDS